MPAIDVSDAFDPDFFDTFILHRRLETPDIHGRSTTVDVVTPNQYGVVTAASPNDLQRLPEADVSLKSITITTLTRIQLESTGPGGKTYKADIIEWAGDFYQVNLVEDYSRFGQGYLWCIAQAIDYTPAPPTPNPVAG